MDTTKRIYKNIIFLSTAEVFSKILQFVIMVYAARLLDQSAFGRFSFALSLSFIAVILSDLGINTLLIREIARNKKSVNKYFINAFIAKIFFVIITYIFIVVLLNLMDYPKDTRYIVYIIWIFAIFSTFTDLFYSVFRAFEKMYFDALIKIVRMIILTTVGLYVLFHYKNVFLFSLTFVFTEVTVLALAFAIGSKSFIKIKLDISLKFIKDLTLKALPFGLAFIFSTIYFYIGSVMLSKMRGDVEVAIYSVAYNIALGADGNAIAQS